MSRRKHKPKTADLTRDLLDKPQICRIESDYKDLLRIRSDCSDSTHSHSSEAALRFIIFEFV